MMLVQKPQAVSLSSPAPYTHRRHPSAPVVVQPTRTPGLLTLSKPVKPSPQRQAPSQYRRELKSASKPIKLASAVVRAQPLTPAAEIKQPTIPAVPATPSPQSRGRSQAKHAHEKAQIYRSASHSSLRGKHGRQPSPPIVTSAQQTMTMQQSQQVPSQAETTAVPPLKSSNLFDPFLDHSNSPPPSPTLGSKPSGKLARRRQQLANQQSTTPSKAIPVPKPQRTKPSSMSRSEPALSHMMQPQAAIHSSTYQDFPVCDDSTEVIDHEYASFPSTPRRSTYRSGPNTSPLPARANGAFDFNLEFSIPSASVGKRNGRKHRRVPSEGVFNMSSDEDLSTGPGGVVLNANVQALFGLGSGKRTSLPASPFSTPLPARDAMVLPMRSRESSPSSDSSSDLQYEARKKAGYFASSMFQNSPSPEELPDPLNL